ncbi:Bifunctional NAD(P)H-hydrate repair enzyme Nnr [BD1-7 clade bacterium]|uniref:Bifunctional NAD(P)H-hydrate repair enzyme n=1 Tax=BD1-7 clade bacterium TaxID=2029982 RepID=A0A5S9N0B4_9GAMM|nr:Bifunctional NAD(P)H-hydrate repair enzyme Nnr [BD1-7 clade bacterium]CAA0082585.1 Bifunctional NAD(P)H-hydrate repair enzyme Nnr [BD1-7 clade bacterium]
MESSPLYTGAGPTTALYSAAQSRAADKNLIENGIAGFTLMCRAAAAAWHKAEALLADIKNPHIDVFCGMGNNGGDGIVLATLAHRQGYAVTCWLAADPQRYQGEALDAWQQASESGTPMRPLAELGDITADLIVDALLGTGLDSDVREPYASAIHAINAAKALVLAIDVPSGINADSGTRCGVAVEADATISFIVNKQGLFTGDGLTCSGVRWFDDLVSLTGDETECQSYASIIAGMAPATILMGLDERLTVLPPRQINAHKGVYGHALLVGGNHGMCGAIMLAAEACARSGAGLTSVATRAENALAIVTRTPEIMSRAAESEAEMTALLERASVIGIGPGLADDEWALSVQRQASVHALPMVIDADALNNIAAGKVALPSESNWVMCPHPKEAARLLGTTVAVVESDRFTAARQLQQQYQAVVVLKGAGTLVCDDKTLWICPHGNPGMASGGMGDVLTGIITALIAQGLSTIDAATLGVSLHAVAGDNAALETGQCALLASDLISPLMQLLP